MSEPWRSISVKELRARALAVGVLHTTRTPRKTLYKMIEEKMMNDAKSEAEAMLAEQQAEQRAERVAADAMRMGGVPEERVEAMMDDWHKGRGDVDVLESRVAAPRSVPTEVEWTTIERMAGALFQAKMVRSRGFATEADVACVLLAARGLNIDPFMATQKINVIDGRASLSAEMMVGLVRAAGYRIEQVEMTADRAVARGVRGDETAEATWTIEDARRANLLGKDNWKKYPMSMLWARAVSQVCRVLFPDVLCGLTYTAEELEGVDAIDVASWDASGPAGSPPALGGSGAPTSTALLPEDCTHDGERAHDGTGTCCRLVIRDRINGLPEWATLLLRDEWKQRRIHKMENLVEADRDAVAGLFAEADHAIETMQRTEADEASEPDRVEVPAPKPVPVGKGFEGPAGAAETVESALLNGGVAFPTIADVVAPPCDADAAEEVLPAQATDAAKAVCPACGKSIEVANKDCSEHPF